MTGSTTVVISQLVGPQVRPLATPIATFQAAPTTIPAAILSRAGGHHAPPRCQWKTSPRAWRRKDRLPTLAVAASEHDGSHARHEDETLPKPQRARFGGEGGGLADDAIQVHEQAANFHVGSLCSQSVGAAAVPTRRS